MKLTRIQRRNLVLFEQYRNRPATIWGLLWFSRKVYLLMSLYFGILMGGAYWMLGEYAAGAVGIGYFSMILRDIGYFRRTAMVWPVLREVIDYEKVSELLKAD